MKRYGIDEKNINFLFNDVLVISNDMVNVTILYDIIFALMLEGEVKLKFIDQGQIERYCNMRSDESKN